MSSQVFAQTGRVARSCENRVASARPVYAGLNNVARLPNALVAQRASRLVKAFRGHVSKCRATASRLVTQANMNLVFVAAEVAPWSKTGGLGDVVGGLPEELAKRGHNVLTIAPRYDQYHDAWDTSVVINVLGEPVRFFHIVKNGVHRVFIDHPWFLAKVWGKTGSKLYGPRSGMDFADNQKRFRLFCEAAIEATKVLPFAGGEDSHFIANDWHSALVPVLLKYVYKPRGEFLNSKVAFCVHNIAFQGRFWQDSFKDLNLPAEALKDFEFTDGYSKIFDEHTPAKEDEDPKQEASGEMFQKVNWMKAGFLTADKGLTVSPNYAKEIAADASKGVELDDIIRAVGGVEGIVNGMDIREWNPATDKYLDVKYTKGTVNEGKSAAKSALQAEAGLPVDPSAPVFGFIGRLEEQKGVDILLAAVQKVAKAGKAQIVILGTGKRKFETAVKKLETSFPGIAKGVVKFSPSLAHLITAGADYMVVPSRFEPCGLIQLHAMQYGTIPLVSSTGGLVDTVKEGKTGFQMGVMDPDDLLTDDVDAVATTMQRAIDAYDTPLFYDMRFNAISQDLSWKKPAQKWEAIMEELVYGAPAGAEKKAAVAVPVALVA